MTRAPEEPCVFCEEPTRVRIAVKTELGETVREAARRICKECFKAIIDHLTASRPAG